MKAVEFDQRGRETHFIIVPRGIAFHNLIRHVNLGNFIKFHKFATISFAEDSIVDRMESKLKNMNLGEFFEKEKHLVLNGKEEYGEYFTNTLDFFLLLNEAIDEINPIYLWFPIFLSHIKTHALLAILSTLRLHHVEAMMNLRQVLENSVGAAYALHHKNEADFFGPTVLEHDAKKISKKWYKWIEKEFKLGSDFIKKQKENINNSSAHANLVYAIGAFRFDPEEKSFSGSYFDEKDEYKVKSDLWFIGNTIMGIVDLFFGVNKEKNVIKFINNFIKRLKELEAINKKLKIELINHPRSKKWISKEKIS